MHNIELPFGVTYNTAKHVEVSIVARSLLANEALIKESAKLLEKVLDGTTVEVTSVRVGELTNGSPLKELLFIGLFFAFQDDLEKDVPDLIAHLTGTAIPEQYTTVVTVLSMIVAISVIDTTVKKFFPGKEMKALKADYEGKLDALCKLCEKSKEEIDTIVKESIGNNVRKRLIVAALDFFLPAKKEGAVSIHGLGDNTISEESVAEIPTELDYLADETQDSYEISGAIVDIHRSDRDSNDAGWRAIIESVSPKKMRMELSPSISAAEVYGKTTIIADVIVVEEKQQDGEYVPKTYHVMKILGDEPE